MRKAQERMRAARPYADKIRNLAANLSQATPEYKHPFMVKNDGAKPAGFIVVTTDKGLCGGLNTNVLRAVTVKLKELEAQGVKAEAVAIGNKGLRLPEPHRRRRWCRTPRSWATSRTSTS